MVKKTNKPSTKSVEAITHDDAKRKNIPTAEYQSVLHKEHQDPIEVAYGRNTRGLDREKKARDRDLDPQLVWRGKDRLDRSDLVVQAPPLYIQEKVHPQVLIEDLRERTERDEGADLFADFNGLPDDSAKTEFYQHDANWSNRMVLGDSLQVMASLAEREGLRGQVQCIYFDPPYGMKFNSNFQWSTTSRDVKDGNATHITREPEQVKAFRDTWRDGVNSYLTYLRDRLQVAKDLLHESGSIFVQIGDENVHRVRTLLDEVFGEDNFISQIAFQTTAGFETNFLGNLSDFVLWYARKKDCCKSRKPLYRKPYTLGEGSATYWMFKDFTYRGVSAKEKRREVDLPDGKPYKPVSATSQNRAKEPQPFEFRGKEHDCWNQNRHWTASWPTGMTRLVKANRIHSTKNTIHYVRYHEDFVASVRGNIWTDTGTGGFTEDKIFVVQTNTKVIRRCLLLATDPGDLVLDPTCGSGTTAYVAEQWGRRWITIDTSRVALALARSRVMGARYPYYLLADSQKGHEKECELSHTPPTTRTWTHNVSHGFVYARVPRVTLKSIANNSEIDVIWDNYQKNLDLLREQINSILTKTWKEWEIPPKPEKEWSPKAKDLHEEWGKLRIQRQEEIDASIAARADYVPLFDEPFEDSRKVRVAGPFTVESLLPHRVLGVNEDDELVDSPETAVSNDPKKFGGGGHAISCR